MNIESKIRELYEEELKNIYSYVYDEGMDHEWILDPGHLCLHIGKKMFKVYDVLYEGLIKIKVKDKEDYKSDKEISYKIGIETPYHIDISRFIIDNYEYSAWFVRRIGVIGKKEENVYRALQIDLYSKSNREQSIFIHSGFFGLEIGGLDKKENWLENSYIPLYGSKWDMFWF